MDLIGMAFGQLMTFLALGIVVAGVIKLFQVATELGEIKDLLGEIKISLSDAAIRPVDAPPPLASPAHLMRAVNAEAQDAVPLYEEDRP
jgi:hypothetical protein